MCTEGARAERLQNNATVLAEKPTEEVMVVAELPAFVRTEIDYLSVPGTVTACRLLDYVINAENSSPTVDTMGATLFQINHARVLEPKANENVCTNAGDRLFPTVRVIDHSGTLTVKMREKAALELSGQSSKEEFVDLVSKGALNFPILCSLRIAVRKSASSEGDAEDMVDAIIVEATEQELGPRAMPNASMDFLVTLMQKMGTDPSRMFAAPISAVHHVRHTGMVVDLPNSVQCQASCVLSLVAHNGRSIMKELPGGTKLISKGGWNVPFDEATEREENAPEHADKKIAGELASYCTNENVQDFTLTGRNPKEPVYALIIISSVQERSGVTTFMVDKVNTDMVHKDNIESIRGLLRKFAGISSMPEVEGKSKKLSELPFEEVSPYKAKRARRLCDFPTDPELLSASEMSPAPET